MYGIPYNRPDQLESVVRYVCQVLERVEFDTIVFRGFSGAIVGPIVALRMGKPWVLVRKNQDASHSCNRIEGSVGSAYVIIDDFIERGTTIREIVGAVYELYPHSRCVGAVLHDECWARRQDNIDKQGYTARINCIPILNWPERFITSVDRKPESPGLRFEIPNQDVEARDRFQAALKPYQEEFVRRASALRDAEFIGGLDPGTGKMDLDRMCLTQTEMDAIMFGTGK